MGGALSTINKIRDEVTGAINRNLDAETGYIGSPPPKFPKTNNPPGTKNLDLNCKVAKIPEVTKIILYECLDELKNDGSYRFSGMEVYWTDKKTGGLSRTAQISGEQDAWRTKEVGAMDFVKALSYSTKNHGGVDYVSFCGLEFQSSDPCGAGTLQLPLTTSASKDPQFVEGAVGFRLIVHKKLKVITQVIPVFSRVSDKKAKLEILEGQVRSFLSSEGVSAERGQKIYDYKAPENKYEDFTSYITSGNIRQEYLGGLPIRLLSPEELNYWQVLVSELKLEKLIEYLQTKGNIHRVQALDKDIKETVVKFLIKVLNDEFFRTKFNTRYVMKMLCIVFNEDPDIWEQVKKVVKPKYDTLAASLFDDAIDQIQRDAKLGELQKIENFQDPNLEGKFQKSCPQCPDKGEEGDDVDKIAKKYMLDSAQYMAEFYATFRSKFGDKFHGAPVKGLERIRAKCQEYQDEAKAAGKQLSKSDSVAKIMDFLRSTIECGSVTEMINAYNEIQQLKGDYKVVRVKNPFKDMSKKVYKSLMLNIMIFDSIIVEVQITVTKMKEANDINHFIYEYQREHSIYAMVSKNLSLTTAFQEWFDPIAPKSMKTNFPRNVNINWKGFWVEGAATSIFDLGRTKRCYFLMHFKIEDNGNISGECGDRYGNYMIKGKLDVNARTLEFTKTPKAGGQGPYGSPMAGPTYEINYKAKFIDKYMAEGTYETKNLQKSGMGNFMDNLNSALAQKGIFRIWCDDMQLPGLNPTLMAFRDVTKDSKIIRKKWLPTKKMKWTGYMGGTGKDGADQPFTLDMKINNPLNVFGGNSLTGKGKLGKAGIHHIDGAHELYDSVILDVFVRPSLGQSCTGAGKARDINMNGFFIEDLKLMGIYDDNGHMGRWELECQDADTRKKWAPKGDNEDDRWELLVTYMDGERQYNQVTFKASNDGSLVGTGNNFTGSFKVEGKLNEKFINLVRTQDGEKLEFDGQFITGGLYEGFFRSPTSYGKFKLAHA